MMLSKTEYWSNLLRDILVLPPNVKAGDALLKEIRILKRQIATLKREMEHPLYAFHNFMCPSKSTQLSCTRGYLEIAINLYESFGYTYKPTRVERKVQEFEDELDEIESITLSIGEEGAPPDVFIVNAMTGERYSPKRDSRFLEDEPYDRDCFLRALCDLHLGEWNYQYTLERYAMFRDPPLYWSLTITYQSGRKPFVREGNSAYPYNFRALAELVGLREWSPFYPDEPLAIVGTEWSWENAYKALHLSGFDFDASTK